ncbi:signal peptidase I [Patescibacteria group bacterium]|nr:signal peptidase I [Patescibacteria group bacterium]MBU3999734.1 signal peptidase I [Patescibacteria group bacterium]MBU4057109.1 signal peptidase I [Patescibacteria group bacterium]MBU4369023.1 signal peptidase I [Patescibacteria group bacterium]
MDFKKIINQLSGCEETENANIKTVCKNFLKFFLEVVKVVIISALIVVPIRYFLIQPFFVSGASMQPQFSSGEYLIIDEIGYRNNSPRRGDVVVFRYPKDPSQFYIKRIIGLPGETIRIKDNKALIFNEENPWGMQLDESSYLRQGEITKGDIDVKLGDSEYFILGDNRQASSDSRVFGSVDKKFIIGKVWLRAWPFGRAKVFSEQVTY